MNFEKIEMIRTLQLVSTCNLRRLSTLTVTPAHSLIDEEVAITGEGLGPETNLKLETVLQKSDERINYKSTCYFRSDKSGSFSTAAQAPCHGSSYEGIHRSGPLWSIRSLPGSKARLWPNDIELPLHYELILSDIDTNKVLKKTKMVKRFMSDNVQRTVIREGPLRGVLFTSPNPGPGIITIYGGTNNGKVPEDRAALLASKGFTTLALAFFGVEDLPPIYTKDGFDLDYFEKAVDYMLSLPHVFPKKLGLFGLSLGGNLSMSMMRHFDSRISACAVSSATFGSMPGPTRYKGKVVVEASEFSLENDVYPLGKSGGLPLFQK